MRDPIDSLPTDRRLEPGVDHEAPALVMTKDGRQIIGRVREIHGLGLELRFTVDGQFRHSQRYATWPELEAAANSKHAELLGVGWEDR